MKSVVDRMEALGRFVSVASPHLPDDQLAPARELIARAGERLSLSRTHTVVALAGSTGTGKSSIFNALSGQSLSQTGVRRPTTGDTHACVFGSEEADTLLDWLKVGRRFHRDAGPGLDGLVLLDLPDFDSVASAHRVEADRLLSIVDLIVWVLHPQKYADKVVHKSYLAKFHEHRDITVVVLNQADLLSPADLQECVADLRQLLRADGLGDVPVITASTVAAPGLSGLTDTLREAVAARQAALRRLGADLTTVVATYHFPAVRREPFSKPVITRLNDALARAAGVPAVARATENAYVHRARKVTGWPPLRWLRRLRPDPLSRLHVGDSKGDATSIGPAAPAAQAGVTLALKETAAQVELPSPWDDEVLAAARSRKDDLPDALDQVIARTDLGLTRARWWWGIFGLLQWVFFAAVVAGLLWLAVRYVLFALALPEPPMPSFGRLPLPTALLIGGVLAGLLTSLVARIFVRVAARRHRRRIEKRMRAGVTQVAQDFVVTPASAVVSAYNQATDALAQAR